MRRVPVLAVIVALLAAACGDDEAVTTSSANDTTTSTSVSTSASVSAPTLTALALSGDVVVEGSASGEIGSGARVATGADGVAVLDTGTGLMLVLLEDTRMAVADLAVGEAGWEGRFDLEAGYLFAVSEGPIDGVFEVQAPGLAAGLGGSALGVASGGEGDFAEASCLFGDCYAVAEGETTELRGNEWIELSAPGGVLTGPAGLTAQHRAIWARVLAALRDAGAGVETCACAERSLRCEGVVEIPFFPGCPDDTTCACEGPDLECADGRAFEDDPECMAAIPALADLLVFPFTATYDCAEARSRPLAFDPTLMLGRYVLRPADREQQGCQLMPWLPETLNLTGVREDGSLQGSTQFTGGDPSDVSGFEDPSRGFYHFGPRFPSAIPIEGSSYSGDRITVTSDAYTLVPVGEEEITVAGRRVRAVIYEGTIREREIWEGTNGVQAIAEITGTHRIWFDAVSGLELRIEERTTYSGCTNCDPGLVGLVESVQVTELVATSQPLTLAD